MPIQLDREITQDFERAAGIEWLEPNGLGGWAGTTVAGAHSRRYHGLLVAATRPEQRTVLLSRLEETLHLAGESFDLGCNRFPGTVAPRGFEFLASFRKDLFPVFEYEAGGVHLRKTVAAVAGENTTLVLYEVLEARGPFVLSLRPFLAARDQHALTSANDTLAGETAFSESTLRLPGVFVAVPGADFQENPQWWYRFEYELERQRGVDYQEDLWTPGVFGRELAAGDRLGVIISTEEPDGRDAFALFEKERKRREKILAGLPKPLQKDELARQLALAGDGFLVRRGSDAMIALPGPRVHGAAGREKAMAAIDELRPRLAEAGVGSLSELFDGEAPHEEGGSRAWSVAEVLRAWVEDLQPGELVQEKKVAVKKAPVKEKVAAKEAKPAVKAKPVKDAKPVKKAKEPAQVKKEPVVKEAVKKAAAPRARKKAPAE
jgi:glycogen debranching enzyme